MEYRGKYRVFDVNRIRTYPIAQRRNRVHAEDLIKLDDLKPAPGPGRRPGKAEVKFESAHLEKVAEAIIEGYRGGKPLIWFTGAHLIKNGLSPIVIDLIKRGVITHYATTGAGAIHDFELALIGETSEHVPNALPQGQFGMAYETGKYMNDALICGNKLKLGAGESLARMILGKKFPYNVNFQHQEWSILAAAYQYHIPATVHFAIGCDIIHQHPNFDGEAMGGCSGRDFLIYCSQVEKLTGGGVILNIGSAVTGPEVLLKALSMASNVGHTPRDIITANFDLREVVAEDRNNESRPTYYFRDIKSVVSRIPEAFHGVGYYIKGDQKQTIPALYQLIIKKLLV